MTINQIKALARKAQRGDTSALELLKEYVRKESKNANARMERFAKADVKSPALLQAQFFLSQHGKTKFGISRNATPESLEKTATALLKFSSAKTGTIYGAKKVTEKNISNIEKQLGIKIPADKIGAVEEFLSSDFFKEFKTFDSERALEDGIQSVIRGANISDIESAWQQYIEGESVLTDAWEEWTEPFLE